MASPTLQFKRGGFSNLPENLKLGEPGFTTDTYELYVGTGATANKFFGSHRYWTRETTSTGSGLNFVEGTNGGTQFITIKAPATLSGITTFTLPGADGTNGQVLTTNGSGTFSFTSPASSSFTIAGGTGTDTVNTGETLTFTGTANEITTAVTDNTVTFGIPDSPSFVTPLLGTPTSGVLTNCTGLPVSTGVSGLATGVATFLATPSSANLISAVTDETGSGSLVFATSPTLVTPALGAATATSIVVGSGVTINASGIIASAGIITASSFVGALTGTASSTTNIPNLTGAIISSNTTTSLGSFSSANLSGALTDKTGTGIAVFATSPTLVTPVLGAATATTIVTSSDVNVGTALSAPTVKTETIKHTDGTTAITISATTGNVGISSDLTVTGNLFVNGSTTQVNTTSLTVEDRTIELGVVDGAAPTGTTSWDLGVLFNYFATSAKKSAFIWEQGDARFKFASVLANETVGIGTTTPQLTVTTFAPIEIQSLFINDCAGASQVISCTGNERFLENITVDAGSF